MIGKLFFLPKRSMLLLTAGVAVTTKTKSFFFLPRLPLSCGGSDFTPGAVPARRSGYCYRLLPRQTTGSLGKKQKLPVVCRGSNVRTVQLFAVVVKSEVHGSL
jgi:hypothetical protein